MGAGRPSPSLVKLAGDLTLGFADGLTVPFALTAGMSFLGSSDAVILAGLAELCAGSISMGIGGFLAMRDEAQHRHEEDERGEEEEQQQQRRRQSASLSRRRRRRRRQQQQQEPSPRSSQGLDREEGPEGEQAAMETLLAGGRGSSSLDDGRSSVTAINDEDDEQDDDGGSSEEDVVRRHLAPLNLPETSVLEILSTMQAQRHQRKQQEPSASSQTIDMRHRLKSFYATQTSSSSFLSSPSFKADDHYDDSDDSDCSSHHDHDHYQKPQQQQQTRATILGPVISGLTIALGYVVGGLIPLFPYFFAQTVEVGMRWSIALCMVALFAFGAGKYWILGGLGVSSDEKTDDNAAMGIEEDGVIEMEEREGLMQRGGDDGGDGRRRRRRKDKRTVKRCLLEGLQILVLGMVAAGAAVLCVQLVNARNEGV